MCSEMATVHFINFPSRAMWLSCYLGALALAAVCLCLLSLAGGQLSTAVREQPPLLPSVQRILAPCCASGLTTAEIEACLNRKDASDKLSSDVLIVTIASSNTGQAATHVIPDIQNFTTYQSGIMKAYAAQHGYTQVSLTNVSLDEPVEDQRWHKIKLLADLLNDRTHDVNVVNITQVKYVLWIDADAIVLDFSMRMEAIGEQFMEADIIASSDVRMGFINSGVMLIRKTAWSAKFFDDWWGTSVDNKNVTCDQDAFDILYKRYAAAQTDHNDRGDNVSRKVKILKMDALNSFPPAMKYQQPYNQILHLMGESTEMRSRVFRAAFGKICDAARNEQISVSLPLQLGANRDSIVQIAESVYSEETQNLVRKCSVHSASEFDDFDELSRSAHHLCDIYELTGGAGVGVGAPQDPMIAASKVEMLRKQLYELVKSKLRHIYKESQLHKQRQSSEAFDVMNFIMLLKRAAEAGNDYFRVASKESVKRVIAAEVFHILDELAAQLADESKNVPIHMSALMHQNLGRLDHEEASRLLAQLRLDSSNSELRNRITQRLRASQGSYEDSARLFESIKESILNDSSAHREYTDTVQMLAASQCLVSYLEDGDIRNRGLYDKAVQTWNRAIGMARKAVTPANDGRATIFVGVQAETLAEVLHNAGVCAFEAAINMSQALEWIESSITIREEIERRSAIKGQSLDGAIKNNRNLELLGYSTRLKNSLLKRMSDALMQTSMDKNDRYYRPPGVPKSGKVLVVIPRQERSIATSGSDNQTPLPMLLDENEWEECEEWEAGCEAFEVKDEIPAGADSARPAEQISKEPVATEIFPKGELSESEIEEIQARYRSMSSRYTIEVATKGVDALVPDSRIQLANRITDSVMTNKGVGKNCPDNDRRIVAGPPSPCPPVAIDKDLFQNEIAEVLKDRIEKLEEIVVVLAERIRQIERKRS
jgi:tetratricopeptide (TPR) repeat protein